jgi:heat-inducible transcriptional repressor
MTTDATALPNLTERQLGILTAVIQFYTEHAEPVASKQLSEKTDLSVSSATIRNDLAVLEQLGLIRAPHTSAGRVPTEEGYRYFVNHLLKEASLPNTEQQQIRHEFDQATQDVQKWLRTAASVLARQTQTAALVTEPRYASVKFKHVQLIATHGHLVLMILVLEGGNVIQQMLTLQETPDQERLTQVSAQVNAEYQGQTRAALAPKVSMLYDPLTQDILELILEVMADAESGATHTIHWYGFADLLNRFEEGEGAQQALRMLDEQRLIQHVLSESIEETQPAVRVLVGGDGRFESISELSLVVGRYGDQQLKGAISVLGPTRMRYGRAVSTVRYVSTLMSAMMRDLYGTPD